MSNLVGVFLVGPTLIGQDQDPVSTSSSDLTGISAGRTSVTGKVTRAFGTSGQADGSSSVTGSLTAGLNQPLSPDAINGASTLHSHFGGRNPHDGPEGSVELGIFIAGDLGVADDINGSTASTADITIERHRLLVIFGNSGVAVEKNLVTHGTVTAGNGTRIVGEPLDVPQPVVAYSAFYV